MSRTVRWWCWTNAAARCGPGSVDGVAALRQPGSTLKPFLYAQALAERRITAASLLEDAPTHIQTAGGLYMPQNYDRQFKGWVSVRTALAASLNVPAVRTLAMVSPQAFHDQLLRLGLPLKESGDYYGYSLALGSAEVSLLDLTNAYRALGNGGRWGPTTLLPAAPDDVPEPARPALDPRAAFIVGDILSDGNARARTFGTDSVLATRFWSAVKTGTSKDMRDNWAIGWSQHYVVGVWVGNASGAPMWDVSGISGAAPLWAALMNYLHRDRASQVRFDDAAGSAPAVDGPAQRVVHPGYAADGVCNRRPGRYGWPRRTRQGCAHHCTDQRHHHRAGPGHSAATPASAPAGRRRWPVLDDRRPAGGQRPVGMVAALAWAAPVAMGRCTGAGA